MQIAGLISAMMAMIVTLQLGFLLEPLPKVRIKVTLHACMTQRNLSQRADIFYFSSRR